MPLIVAFGHRKRTGKDTFAQMLFEELGKVRPDLKVVQVSFAAKLKEVAYDLFKWGGLQPGPFYELAENAHLREVALPIIGKTPRQIWIEVGNKLREVDQRVWLRNALYVEADIIIVRDLRYWNEADEVEAQGGFRYKIIRDCVEVSHDVADENLANYRKWCGVIPNNGTLDDLRTHTTPVIERILNGPLRLN